MCVCVCVNVCVSVCVCVRHFCICDYCRDWGTSAAVCIWLELADSLAGWLFAMQMAGALVSLCLSPGWLVALCA